MSAQQLCVMFLFLNGKDWVFVVSLSKERTRTAHTHWLETRKKYKENTKKNKAHNCYSSHIEKIDVHLISHNRQLQLSRLRAKRPCHPPLLYIISD
jgi:hypothetical protein